jgi:competence protein ComGF
LGIRYLIKIILISTIFLTILGFSIYKSYYVSEQKTKQVSIYSLFVREYITRISQVQKLQNSKLLAKKRKYIEMYTQKQYVLM